MTITDGDLRNWFTYHEPLVEQRPLYERIRTAGYKFAQEILACTPPSADQTTAIRRIREAVMIANSSIACGGK